MPDAVTIRSATAEDAAIIADIHSKSWQSAYRDLMSDDFLINEIPDIKLEHWKGVFHKSPCKKVVLLAFFQDQAIGFIAIYLDHYKNYDGYIDNIHILPNIKGQGMGQKLMSVAATELLKLDKTSLALVVFTDNDGAIGFYQKLGGEIVGETSEMFGGKDLPEYIIAWKDASVILDS